jgi:hypothetical protein
MTPPKDKPLELAERCEAATGADRELNRLIFATIKPEKFADAAEATQYAEPGWRGLAFSLSRTE